jgi:hypothetical protein
LNLAGGANGHEQPVLETLEHWGWWALGEKGIYFLDAQLVGSSGIYFDVQPPPQTRVTLNYLNRAAETTIELAALVRPVSTCTRTLALSPNGKYLLYEQLDRQDSDIMMIDNLSRHAN